MTNVAGETEQLAALQTFDPRAFIGNKDVPQELCSFVLTLALIYNDLKDGLFTNILLTEWKPRDKQRLNRSWGNYNGLWAHHVRLHFALVHEFLKLLAANKTALENPFFIAVTRQLPSDARKAWDTLVDASAQKTTSNPANKALLMVRNKVSFHYDPKEVFRGYREHFLREPPVTKDAFISRGGSMRASRFYFADAAAASYLQSLVESSGETENRLLDLTNDLALALKGIVDRFIQRRGVAYRDYNAEASE